MHGEVLKSYKFRKEREKTWRRLEHLVTMVEGQGLKALSGKQLSQLPVLYRAALSSLSVARSISLDKNLLEYLETLCQRAYFCVYGTKRHLREVVAEFFLLRFPQSVRRFRWHLVASTVFLLMGTAAGYFLTIENPDNFYAFVAEDYAQGRGPHATTQSMREGLYDDGGAGAGALSYFSSYLFTHNARVGILCFALGFLAGVPVFLLMVTNGLLLGAFAAAYEIHGLSVDLWGWLLPHGVTELLAILLCGAAGLALGQSLVFPGRERRLRNLANAGREAGIMVMGSIVMLFFAGLIEGIFRQTVKDINVRYAVVFSSVAFWVWYLGFVGRGRARRGTDA